MKSLVVKQHKFKTNKKKLQTVKHKYKHTKTHKKHKTHKTHIGGASVSANASASSIASNSAESDFKYIIFYYYLSKHEITYGPDIDKLLNNVLYTGNELQTLYQLHKLPTELQYQDKAQAPDNPLLIFSDHAPILYTVDEQEIIVWNIGQWGCEKHIDKTTKAITYNHKFYMGRRETFAEYNQRLINIISVLNQFVKKYPNAIFCLQEIPNMFIDFNVNEKGMTIDNLSNKIDKLFNDDDNQPDRDNILYEQMSGVQTMFYEALQQFMYNKEIDKDSSNVLIMYGNDNENKLQYNPLFIYKTQKGQINRNFNRADGFWYLDNYTHLIAFISVHFSYPSTYKKKQQNAAIIIDIFNAIIKIIRHIQQINTISNITVYMCGDFNTSSEKHNANMRGQYILFKRVIELFEENGLYITINSFMYSPPNAKSSLNDNNGGITTDTIDYINKFNVKINRGKENTPTQTIRPSRALSFFKP